MADPCEAKQQNGVQMVNHKKLCFIALILIVSASISYAADSGSAGFVTAEFPRTLEGYQDDHLESVVSILVNRIKKEPFNLFATLIFLGAIVHTFFSSRFIAIANKWQRRHNKKILAGKADAHSMHFGAGVFHFLGEVEVIFGIWAVALGITIGLFYNWSTVVYYIGEKVNYTEPLFVVVIMALASTRPILKLAELAMWKVSKRLGGMLKAWWLTILTIGPLLGSVITEPAAMTICAYLLAEKFYDLKPSERFKYATLGLLFVNVSVGGTLSHFAAPPVIMVAGPWGWDFVYMLSHFGWKALLGILIATSFYYYIFRDEIRSLEAKFAVIRRKREIQRKYVPRKEVENRLDQIEQDVSVALGFIAELDRQYGQVREHIKNETLRRLRGEVDGRSVEDAIYQRFDDIKLKELKKTVPGLLPEDVRPPFQDPDWDRREELVPGWIMIVHLLFMAWTVINAHYPALVVGGFMFFLGFAQVTYPYQNRIDLKPPLLVGFFLAGLVIHGGVQAWWIAPLLGNMNELPLILGSSILTAFNDNAAITYLSTLVPGFTESLKYAVVAGAVAGGGLTVIANAPNPAGQSILKRYFEDGVSPVKLLKAALVPTITMLCVFTLLRF